MTEEITKEMAEGLDSDDVQEEIETNKILVEDD